MRFISKMENGMERETVPLVVWYNNQWFPFFSLEKMIVKDMEYCLYNSGV